MGRKRTPSSKPRKLLPTERPCALASGNRDPVRLACPDWRDLGRVAGTGVRHAGSGKSHLASTGCDHRFCARAWHESHACGDRRQRLRNTHSGGEATDRGRPPVNPAARRQVLPMGQQPTPRSVRGVSSAGHLRLSTATKTWTPVRRAWGRHGPPAHRHITAILTPSEFAQTASDRDLCGHTGVCCNPAIPDTCPSEPALRIRLRVGVAHRFDSAGFGMQLAATTSQVHVPVNLPGAHEPAGSTCRAILDLRWILLLRTYHSDTPAGELYPTVSRRSCIIRATRMGCPQESLASPMRQPRPENEGFLVRVAEPARPLMAPDRLPANGVAKHRRQE